MFATTERVCRSRDPRPPPPPPSDTHSQFRHLELCARRLSAERAAAEEEGGEGTGSGSNRSSVRFSQAGGSPKRLSFAQVVLDAQRVLKKEMEQAAAAAAVKDLSPEERTRRAKVAELVRRSRAGSIDEKTL